MSGDAIAGARSGWPSDLDAVERSLLDAVSAIVTPPTPTARIDPMLVATWLEAQVTSRLVDHTARWLRARHDIGYYTIGSAGHESNAIVASVLRPTDPALLHYRSGGFYVARSMQAAQAGLGSDDAVRDMLRGMLARSTEPIAGGRHKVFGNRRLAIIPQTSTIASHLPRAVGLAASFDLAPDAPTSWPRDSVVVCSFGDGSLNHSTAQGALNWAAHAAHSGRRVPLLFVCEDNGLGLSVATPDGWVAASIGRHAAQVVSDDRSSDPAGGRRTTTGAITASADGSDPHDVWRTTSRLVDVIRTTGRPALLHLSTVRFLGHAGTDVESAYRTPEEVNAGLLRDPILGTARLAAATGVSSPDETIEWYLDLRGAIREMAVDLCHEPELTTAAEVMEPLTSRTSPAVVENETDESSAGAASAATASSDTASGDTASGDTASGDTASSVTAPGAQVDADERLTFAQTITRMLGDLLAGTDDVVVFGEDVGRKGGVYGVTRGLQKRFGGARVFDTHLDEQSILGLALGSALNGRLPIPEIQYLAYLHNAEDQLRGEAASLAFFSQRQYLNPMVVRIAAYGYQKGFGGHFHNDNSITVLRDIPGLVIASPAHPADAAGMLRSCVDHVRATGAVCVFLEPIARYHDPDLHEGGDGGWTAPYDPAPTAFGAARMHQGFDQGAGDLTIITWANGLHLSLRAARDLERNGVRACVLDLRWIAPMPVDRMLAESQATGRVLVVDETRRTGGVGEGIVAELVAAGFTGPIGRVAAQDSFVPLGAAANLVLVGVDDIVAAAHDVVDGNHR